MKTTVQNLLAAIFIAFSLQTHAQGTLVFDQQSTIPPSPLGDYLDIQPTPLTQSFIPSLSAIGFVQFEFDDFPGNGNNGATVFVNLWIGSPDPRFGATLLGSTAPVSMPNGFGSVFAGVTNFFFSTSITLTPGETYYLQPVVLSGDNPWDVYAPSDSYANGQLFVGGAGFSTDLWFREGIVSVPEPCTLALVGLGSLLIYTFKRRSRFVVPLLLFIISVLSIHASDSVVQATADAAGLTPVSAVSVPDMGTFWVVTVSPDGELIESPDPFLPPSLSTLPIYSAGGDKFIVDNTGGQLMPSSAKQMSSLQAASAAQSQAESMTSLISQMLNPDNESFQPNGFTPMVFTNGLWLEASNEAPNLGLRAHNTIIGDYYQLLSTTNLSVANWNLGQILNASDTQMDFTPVPMTNALTFFWAHHANPVMLMQDIQDSREPDATNSDPGQVGSIYIENEGFATNDVTVYYTLGGTAQNGVDYTNLTGTATVPLNQGFAEIDIQPLADGLKPDQTVILTLLQNTNYLIDPALASATNTLVANPQVYPTIRGDKEQICPDASWPIDLASDVNDPRGLPLTYTILTWPTHGTLDTNAIPELTYTSTNCYEGQDSLTFKVNDGQFDSSPATVTLIITNNLFAFPVTGQTCRGTPVIFNLIGGDSGCGAPGFAVSPPLHGSVTNVSGLDYLYTPNDTNFTGTDTFNYTVFNSCGDSVTSTVSITVGDASLQANSQNVMTATNRPVAVTLTASDFDPCNGDTNFYAYTLTGSLTNGVLSGTPPDLTYTPTNGEGFDSFQFTVSDGVWTSPPATVSIYVVAGPILFPGCNPFQPGVQLDWSLDASVQMMVQEDGLNISDFIIYRSAVSGGSYTAIATNNPSQMSYFDASAVIGQTNYYVVNFESPNSTGSANYESPMSNEIEAAGHNPDDLIPPNAVWNVVTNLSNPTNVAELQAPFSNEYPGQYPNLLPLPNTYWPAASNDVYSVWSNHIVLVIPTSVTSLSNVQYAIAIDNDYQLYLNNSNAPIETFNHEGPATWAPFKAFEDIAPGLLHYGTNDLGVVIQDEGAINYFSMVVTTNTCGP